MSVFWPFLHFGAHSTLVLIGMVHRVTGVPQTLFLHSLGCFKHVYTCLCVWKCTKICSFWGGCEWLFAHWTPLRGANRLQPPKCQHRLAHTCSVTRTRRITHWCWQECLPNASNNRAKNCAYAFSWKSGIKQNTVKYTPTLNRLTKSHKQVWTVIECSSLQPVFISFIWAHCRRINSPMLILRMVWSLTI